MFFIFTPPYLDCSYVVIFFGIFIWKMLNKSFHFEKWVTSFWLPSILTPTILEKPRWVRRKINDPSPFSEKGIIFYGRRATLITNLQEDPARFTRLATIVLRCHACRSMTHASGPSTMEQGSHASGATLNALSFGGRSPHCCPRSSDSVPRPANSGRCSMLGDCSVLSLKCIAPIYLGDRLTNIFVCYPMTDDQSFG